jgi:hypothetical protein
MVAVPINRIELAVLAKLVETGEMLVTSMPDADSGEQTRRLVDLLIAASGRAAFALTPGASETALHLGESEVAGLRDLRLVFTVLASRLHPPASDNLVAFARTLGEILDRADIAITADLAPIVRQAAGIPGAPEHG